MAQGQWVTVPGNLTQSGKPERRYQMKSGQYRTTEPNSPEWYDEMYVKPASNAVGGLREFLGGLAVGMEALNASYTPAAKKPNASIPPVISVKDASGRDDQGADLDMEFIKRLKDETAKSLPQELPRSTGLSDDADVRQSALEAMRQQYAPSTGIYDTDAGKAMLASAQQAQYTGDQAGLPEFYANQQKVGAGLTDEIIDAMGYTGGMAEWAKANPALAMREYNKKFANSYEGTGPGDEAIQQAMDQGKFYPSEGSPNPLGETGVAREMNTAQISAAQPTNEQFYAKEGLLGKEMLQQLMNKMERI